MGMNIPKSCASLLQEMVQIQQMERGKLSVMREGPAGPYYKLQAWEEGKNVSRYIPADQVPAVQQALQGYQEFQELTGQYAARIIHKTRVEIAAGSKKKPKSRSTSSLPKTAKSDS